MSAPRMVPLEPGAAATVAELRGLAAGLCRDSGVRVVAGDSCWHYDQATREIHVPRADLVSRGTCYCAGVLAHEVGHFHITRYHSLRHGIDFPSERILSHLLNATEDPRVNRWVRARFPGTALWYGPLRGDFRDPPALVPEVFCFAVECHAEEMRDWQPRPGGLLPARVERALAETRSARAAMAACLPAVQPGAALLDPRLPARAAGLLARVPPVGPVPSDPWELEVLAEQARSLALFRDSVAARALSLVEADIVRIGWHLMRRGLLGRTRRLTMPGWATARAAVTLIPEVRQAMAGGPEPPATWSPDHRERAGLLRLLELFLDDQFPLRPPIWTASGPAVQSPPGKAPQEAAARVDGSDPDQPGDPLDAGLNVAGVDHLERLVREGLNPRRHRRHQGAFPSGSRLSMREAMRLGAEPERYRRLWQRRTRPTQPDAAFGLMVDLSGSMAGPKAEAAVRGTLLLAQTLSRLEVPCLIHGFQDRLIPLVSWEERYDETIGARIASMALEAYNSRPGGNNRASSNDDGPCLEEFAGMVRSRMARQRFLVVVSDGEPAGSRSDASDLRRAVAGIRQAGDIQLIGLGLGPGTGHVRDFYPRAIANVAEADFPARIGGLILEACGVA